VFINDPLVASPGERVSYSTFGYTLASIVLETAAKLPFLELVQRDIATPLGLATLSGDAPMSLVTHRVSGYHPGDNLRKAFPPSRASGATSRRTIPRTNGRAAGC
jgi:CubicO group peptidase (beta-lactamase class C family)